MKANNSKWDSEIQELKAEQNAKLKRDQYIRKAQKMSRQELVDEIRRILTN